MAYNQFMKSKLRLNAKAFPLIGIFAFAMQIIDPSRVWVILLIAIGGTWLFCRWWARGLVKSLQFKREIRYGWAQVGDKLEERFTLINPFSLPMTWVVVHDQSTLPDHHTTIATGVDGQGKSQWKILNQCTRRGVYQLGGTRLETGDPFGVYTVTVEDPTFSTLAVMPPVLPLPRFEILTSGWAGDGRTNPHSLEETINASHTREMLPGDPMKQIHWKTTAKRGKFFVRQTDGTNAGNWWILLDLHKDSQVGTGSDSTEEHGVILASSLIAQGLNEDHPVGLAINGNEPAWHVPLRNEYQQRSLLKSLAVASPADMELKDYLQRSDKAFGSRCSLLVITACANVEWIQTLIPLMWRGILPTVFLIDVNTFGGKANTSQILSILQSLGVPCHIIPKELLDKPQARPGHEGSWEWRVTATGKAIAINRPVEEWRELG